MHLRYCLSDGSGDPSTEQINLGLQNEDIGVVRGGATQQLWEVFQAEALQGAKGEEWETWRMKTGVKLSVTQVKEDI